jgi:peptidoglycan/LPS O-acetylase OafA/YrhL
MTCARLLLLKDRHHHIPELQSIRGIAAAVVLLCHAAFLFATTPTFRYWSEVVLNAHAAVMLFFVLSGYVLSRSLSGPKLEAGRIGEFYLARAFRIYPALWFACGMGLIYLVSLHFAAPTLHPSNWYLAYFKVFPSSEQILVNFTLGKAPAAIVPPSWSIFVEMLGSLALPFFVLANRRGVGAWLFALTVVVAVIATETGHLDSLTYLPSFAIGSLAFRYQDRLKPYFANLPMLIICFVGIQFFRRFRVAWRFEVNYVAFVPTLIESVFAVGIILSVAARPVTFLRNRALIWLGDISYSLYLIHFILMSALAKVIGTINAPIDILAIALMTATLVSAALAAWGCYVCVEKPGIGIGKKMIGTIKNLTPKASPPRYALRSK